jgi:hypothetical protein
VGDTDQGYRANENDAGGYDWRSPPANAVHLDDAHAIARIYWSAKANAQNTTPHAEQWLSADEQSDRVWVGIDEWHRKADGRWCVGYCLFAVPEADLWAQAYVGGHATRWQVVSFEPLTITPSIACKVCPSHGFITNGRWSGT